MSIAEQSHRKDEHVFLAEKFHNENQRTDFDAVRFVHQSLPEISVSEVDIRPDLDFGWRSPFYINAMTGGSKQTEKLNQQLAQVAAIANLPMASGSQSVALAEPSLSESFEVIRQENPTGFVMANLGADVSLEAANRAITMLHADALQIHLNVAQELIMPEGDRRFYWRDNLQALVVQLPLPVIVKEVGFGMSQETLQQLREIGVQYVDLSGRGGTNFIQIENERRPKKEYRYLENWGQSTVESLLESQAYQDDFTILASGGIRNPFDIVKALRLGAKAVGLSGTFLHFLLQNGPTKAAAELLDWQAQIQNIFALLGAKNVQALRQKPIILSPELLSYLEQRHLTLKN